MKTEQEITCLEISINGKKVCTAGDKMAEVIDVSILSSSTDNEQNDAHISIGGVICKDDARETVNWLNQSISIGEAVEIQLVRCDSPDAPSVESKYGNITTNGKTEKYCSFCGVSEHDSEFMMKGMAGNICKDCIQLSAEALEENS